MKKILIELLLLSGFFANAQSPLEFSKVIQAEGKNQTELFILINDWFAVNYNSANDVIQMADKDAGIIIGKGSTEYSFGKLTYSCYEGRLKYTLKVSFKDNRFKVDLTNFVHSVNIGNSEKCEMGLLTDAIDYTDKGLNKNYHNKVWDDLKLKSEDLSNSIFTLLEEKVKTETKDDDW
jgi:hypothetical protein